MNDLRWARCFCCGKDISLRMDDHVIYGHEVYCVPCFLKFHRKDYQ